MCKPRFRHLRMSGQLFLLLSLIIAVVFAGAAISLFADGGSPVIAAILATCAAGALIEAWQIRRRLR